MPFNALDVEQSLEEVLEYYDLHPDLTVREFRELKKELLKLTLKAEMDEMVRTLDTGITSGVDRVMRRLFPGGMPADGFTRGKRSVSAVRRSVAFVTPRIGYETEGQSAVYCGVMNE
jgi:hypothetical protein